MTRISSRYVFVCKTLFAILWFGVRGVEEDIPLSNVMNVSVSMYTNPSRITLRLVTPGKFGTELSFSPIRRFWLNPFAKNPLGEELIVRVDQARSRRVS
jgi:hypothetical protein